MVVDIFNKTIEELQDLIVKKIITVQYIHDICHKNIQKYKKHNILIDVYKVKSDIIKSQEKYNNGTYNSLEGMPIIIKDNFLIKGVNTTCGSKFLENNFISPDDSEIVNKIKKNGGIIIGRANLDEFAMGDMGIYSLNGPVLNPWNEKYATGGSSSGSAAAIACNMGILAIGSDTGGSGRVPSSICGVLGFKPTYGAISRYGLVPLCSELDTVAIISNQVKNIQLSMEIFQGQDPKDLTSHNNNILQFPVNKKKIAIIKEFNGIKNIYNGEKIYNYFISMGYEIKEITLPIINYALPWYFNIVPGEVMSNMAKYTGINYGPNLREFSGTILERIKACRSKYLGPEVQRRILTGVKLTCEHFGPSKINKLKAIKDQILRDFDLLFKEYTYIIHPVATHSPRIATKQADLNKTNDLYTVVFNILGAPSISIPSYMDLTNNLPQSIGISSFPGNDHNLLSLANKLSKFFNFKLLN